MATSGSTSFNLTRDGIIAQAMRLLGIIALGEASEPEDLQNAVKVLNITTKRLNQMDIPLWKQQQIILFPENNKTKYTLGNASARMALEYVQAYSLNNAEIGDDFIELESISDVNVADVAGVQCDDGSIFWTTITNIFQNIITLASPLTVASSSGNYVFIYTTAFTAKPMKIKSAVRVLPESNNSVPLVLLERERYLALSSKYSQGPSNSFYYQPRLNTGDLYLWQSPEYLNQIVIIDAILSFEDFVDVLDDPDFPPEYLSALIYSLAEDLIPYYGIIGEKAQFIIAKAAEYRRDARDYDREDGSIYFGADMGDGIA